MENHPQPHVTATTYATTELSLAAYLQVSGAKLLTIIKDDKKSSLVFADPDFCLEYARRFATGDDDEVSASAYAAALKMVKALALRGGF